jgi:hypothetical protein
MTSMPWQIGHYSTTHGGFLQVREVLVARWICLELFLVDLGKLGWSISKRWVMVALSLVTGRSLILGSS